MRSDDLESSVLRRESLSDGKGNDGGEVTGEEVLPACLQLPILNLLQLGKAVIGQVPREPLDCMVRRDSVVDKGKEGVR